MLNSDKKWDECVEKTKTLCDMRRLLKIDILKGESERHRLLYRDQVFTPVHMAYELSAKHNMSYEDIIKFCIPSTFHGYCYDSMRAKYSLYEITKYNKEKDEVTKDIHAFISEEKSDEYSDMKKDEKENVVIRYHDSEDSSEEEDFHDGMDGDPSYDFETSEEDPTYDFETSEEDEPVS